MRHTLRLLCNFSRADDAVYPSSFKAACSEQARRGSFLRAPRLLSTRELGLLRKRTLSSSSAAQKQTKSTDQQFAYLIIIDFESTCWKDDKFKSQEIIEFPAVLLNTSSGEIESEFHHYVQPQEQPTLSAFCTELTGITQDKVDDGIPINFCLKRFCHWLDKLQREKNVVCYGQTTADGRTASCTFVTWSDWDLGVCLQYECKRKQLLKPVQLTSWIDLRATYRKFYDRKPNGLNGALQDLGIQFEGREHSGLDDSRNTAKLAFRMIQDGCVLKVTKTLKPQEKAPSSSGSISKHFLPATRITPPRKAKKTATPTKPMVRNSSALPKQSDQGNLKSRIPKPVRVVKGNEADVNQKKTPVKVKVNGELSSPCAGTDSPVRKRRKKYDGSSSPANKLLNSANGNSQHSVKTTLYKNKMSSLSQKSETPSKTLKKISPTTFKPKDIYQDPVDTKHYLEQSEQISKDQTRPGLTEQDMNIKVASKNTDDENEERNLEKIFKKPISPRLNPTAPRIAKTQQSFGNSGCIGISATTQHNSSQQYKPKTLPMKPGNSVNKFQTSTPKSLMGAPNGFIKSSTPSPITCNSSLSSKLAKANLLPPGTPVNKEGQPISKSESPVHLATSTAAVFKTPSPVSVARNSVDSGSASSKFMTPIPVTLVRSSNDSGNSSTMFKTPSPVAVNRNLSASGNSTSVFKTPSPVTVAKNLVDSGNSSSMFKTPSPVSVTRNTVDSGNSSSMIKTPSPVTRNIVDSGNSSSVSKTPSSVSVTRNSVDSGNSSSVFRTPPSVSVTRSSVDSGNSSSVFKTPSSVATSSSSSVTGSAMKCTPPLCKCGRRSKRRMVQSPGQNMGRFFFSCSVRQSVGSKNGCDFFKWETSFNQSNTTSGKSPYVGKQFTPVTGGYFKTPTVRGGSFKTPTVGGFKKNLGMRSVSNTPACTFRV